MTNLFDSTTLVVGGGFSSSAGSKMNWSPLKLKVREAQFFANQLRAHTNQPQLFLFYLSAFLSSARSISFHLQKKFAHTDKDVYQKLSREVLQNQQAKFFKETRNFSEKEGYPPLKVDLLSATFNHTTGNLVWRRKKSVSLFEKPDDDDGLRSLNAILEDDWELIGFHKSQVALAYKWTFSKYPDGPRDVVTTCEEFGQLLWAFLVKFRGAIEEETNRTR
jgi:hypothetical protein